VVLGGDITDELTSFEDMNRVYQILSDIDTPVYFVHGNHDRQPDFGLLGGRTYSDEQLEKAITNAGVRILSDEFVRVADDLVLLGREDMSAGVARKPWPELDNPYQGKGALVVVDHQPYDSAQLIDEKSALQLSGHTHAGQLWPLQAVYRAVGLPAYGEFECTGTRLYVTAGESGWSMPFRTEEHCEWDLIALKP
jgi:predicted MPP superfamily phosphohydrolase